jgi:uncharacterized membrane protein YhaH (DUF805 family)
VSNIYSPPSADVSNIAIDDVTYEPKMLSLSGRIGRLRLIAYSLAFGLIAMFAIGIVAAIGAFLVGPKTAIALSILLYIPMLVLSIAFSVRRLNDLNHSGWWVLLSFVPFLNFLYILYVLFAPGTNGANEFGAAPSPNPTWVKVCALILPVLFFAGMFAAMSSGAYQSYLERAGGAGRSSEQSL